MGGPVVIGGDNLPSPVRIGLTVLQNIGGASGPPGPPGSGTTAIDQNCGKNFRKMLIYEMVNPIMYMICQC